MPIASMQNMQLELVVVTPAEKKKKPKEEWSCSGDSFSRHQTLVTSTEAVLILAFPQSCWSHAQEQEENR